MVNDMKRIVFIFILSLCSVLSGSATERDSTDVTEKGFKGYLRSLLNGHEDRTFEKAMDITYIAAPCYTREGSVGIGGAATALYRLDRTDSIMQPSDLQFTASAAIKGFYSIGLKGNNNFKGNRSKLTYSIVFNRKTLDFWGITYEDCSKNSASQYVRQQIKFDADYIRKIPNNFKLGAGLNINYTEAAKILDPSYLNGEKKSYFFTGFSAVVQYDTRDFVLNPKRGVFMMLKETLYPKFVGSFNKTLLTSTFQFNAFHGLWKNAIIGYDLYGQFNSSSAPWTLREELGSGACRMRGYYSGRYIDCSIASAQVELRQHIINRFGFVAWVGAGSVFPSLSDFRVKNILPNYGVGLRIEVKHNVNMRIDYGYGKNTAGLVFQMTEAF